MPKKFIFLGRVLPAAKTGVSFHDLHPNDFPPDATEQLRLSSTPICRLHNPLHIIGEILGNFQYEDGSQLVWGRVDDEAAREEIRSGELKELSMTHYFDANFNPDGTEVQTRILLEISAVKEGERPNCHIFDFFEFDSKVPFSKVNFSHLFENMASPAEPNMQAAPGPAPTDAAAAANPAAAPAGAASASAGAPAPSGAPVSQPLITPDGETVDQLRDKLMSTGLTLEDAVDFLAKTSIGNHTLKSQLSELEKQNEKLRQYEQMASAHDSNMLEAYEELLTEHNVPMTEEARTAIMSLIKKNPTGFKTVMASSKELARNSHDRAFQQLQAFRAEQQGMLSKKPQSANSALDFVRQASELDSKSHRTGSHSASILSNSKIESEIDKIRNQAIPIIRVPEKERPRQKTAEEIISALGGF